MKANVGRCGLCFEERELQDSHLMPAALYKLIRKRSHAPNPNPVVVTGKRSFTTSDQVSAHFLCHDCEERFHSKGEDYVLSQCAKPSGTFKLRELLEASDPVASTSQASAYKVSDLLGNKADKYLYFAASVFWRASARSWTFDSQELPVSLGYPYQEQLRLYLLGEGGFPPKARLWVHVSRETEFASCTVFPYSERGEGKWRHKFYIPGVLFILFLGGSVPEDLDQWALNAADGGVMCLTRVEDDSLYEGSVSLVRESRPSRNLVSRRSMEAG